MIKLKDILLESDIFIPRRTGEGRKKRYIAALHKYIQDYINNGSKGSLILNNSPIVELPDDLKHIGHSLDLYGSSIQKLPDNFVVNGSLFINYTPISKLPDNLTVGGDLFMNHTRISEIPKNLKVGGNIDVAATPLSEKYEIEDLKKLLPGVKGNIYYHVPTI